MQNKYFRLHFVILVFGFTAILGKLITISPLLLVVYRTFIAALALFVWLKFKKISLKLNRQALVKLLSIGALIGLHWLCFFSSARLANVSISLIAISTMSFFTSLIVPFIHKSKFNPIELLLGLMAIVGIGIIFKFEYQYLRGFLVGLMGSLIGTLFSIFNAKIDVKLDNRVINFYELIGAFAVTALFVFMAKYFGWADVLIVPLSSKDLLWLLILAIACTVYPYIELLNLYTVFSVFTVNLSLNMEPIYGIIMAVLIFGQSEAMSSGFYIGGILVMSSVLLQPVLNKYTQKSIGDVM